MRIIRKQFDTNANTKRSYSAGFVLSFSVLIAGVLLSIGLAMFSITLKELILSSGGRESQFAFYAADTGGECALYWDIKHPGYSGSAFAPLTDSGTSSSYRSPLPPESGLECNSEDISDPATGWDPNSGWDVTADGTATTTVFDMDFDNGACATVTVKKTLTGTRIDALGYNSCPPPGGQSSDRRVERGLRITY